jgi:hypothetical protein
LDNSTQHFKLVGLELDRVDLVTAGANPGAHILIHKFAAPDILQDKTAETLDVQPDEVDKQMADVENVETVAKADFEAVQKQLEEMSKALEAAQAAQAADAEKIAKMERERKEAEYIAKAREFSNLGKADELGALLLAASEAFTTEQYQTLERLLKAANAQVEKGDLFAQFSRPDADSGDVLDRINVLAKAKVEAGEAKTLEIAKQMVLRENRELQSEYIKSR